MPQKPGIRLNRYLASCGCGSRRGCEELITEGRVEINGDIVRDLSRQVIAETDVVKVDGSKVRPALPKVVVLYKPEGYICTHPTAPDQKTIYDLLPFRYQNLNYVGRLDVESEGILLLTNDGELSYRLTHPRFGLEKEYQVTLDRAVQDTHLPVLERGVDTPEGFAKAEQVIRQSARRIRVILKQGLKRQIREMFANLGYEVKKLVRVRFGPLTLRDLPTGAYAELKSSDVAKLVNACDARAEFASARSGKPKRPDHLKPTKIKRPSPYYTKGPSTSAGARQSSEKSTKSAPTSRSFSESRSKSSTSRPSARGKSNAGSYPKPRPSGRFRKSSGR